MSWETEEFGPEHFEMHPRPRPRVWQENVEALAQVTPTGKLTTTNPQTGRTVELNPNVESHILSFLTPRKILANRRKPLKLLQKNAILRSVPAAANNMRTRRNRRNFRREAEVARQREAANRQAEANRRAQYNEFIRNTNLRSNPVYHQVVREQEARNARIASRAKRGMTNNKGKPSWLAKMKPRNKSRKRKN